MRKLITIIVSQILLVAFVTYALTHPISMQNALANGMVFAVCYCLASWISGYAGWSIYKQKVAKGIVHARGTEMFSSNGIHYASMAINLVLAFILGILFVAASAFFPFLGKLKIITIIFAGIIVGTISGYLMEKPSRREYVNISDRP